MYFDVNNMLISEKEIKKISYVKQDKSYYLFLVGNDNPSHVKLSHDECGNILQSLRKKDKKYFCVIDQDFYFVESIYDIEANDVGGCLFYKDGTNEKVENKESFQKLKNMFNQYNNQDDYQI